MIGRSVYSHRQHFSRPSSRPSHLYSYRQHRPSSWLWPNCFRRIEQQCLRRTTTVAPARTPSYSRSIRARLAYYIRGDFTKPPKDGEKVRVSNRHDQVRWKERAGWCTCSWRRKGSISERRFSFSYQRYWPRCSMLLSTRGRLQKELWARVCIKTSILYSQLLLLCLATFGVESCVLVLTKSTFGLENSSGT